MAVSLASLEHFLLVAEHGSFSRAASVAGVAQTTLGRQIQKLEQENGCRLFYRNGRGVALTPEGDLYFQRVQPLIEQLRAAGDELHAQVDEVGGEVVIGMPPVPLEMLGLALLASSRREFPKIKMNILSAYSGHIHEWLVDGRLDIAILHDARRSKHIRFDPLAECDLYLVSAPAALAPGQRATGTVEFATLGQYHLVLPSRTHGLRRTVEEAASSTGVTLQVDAEIDTLPLTKNQVLRGEAHTVLPLPAVMQEVISSQLIARRLVSPELRTSLGLVTATNRPLTRAMRSMLGLIRRELNSVIARSGPDLGIRLEDASTSSAAAR
jgi:LysR family nitrogen assimilation transcriptional regulator